MTDDNCKACGHARVFHQIGRGTGVPIGKAYCDDRHSPRCECTGFVDRAGFVESAERVESAESPVLPIPMILTCPTCSGRHIDVGMFATKVHHTHACQHCGMVWRPAIVPTVGVQFLPGFKNA